MKDNMTVGIVGKITILRDGVPVFRRRNTITGDALQIIMRCLSNIPNDPSVDVMKLQGDFDDTEISIFDSEYDTDEGSITFKATAFEGTFSGTLTSMQLSCSLLGLNIAEKTGLSITKDGDTRLEFRWTIKIINC